MLFLGGILGRLFREFAVTITTAVVISGLVSISLTPMLCSPLLHARAQNAAEPWTDRAFDAFRRQYARSLTFALRHVYLHGETCAGAAALPRTGRLSRRCRKCSEGPRLGLSKPDLSAR